MIRRLVWIGLCAGAVIACKQRSESQLQSHGGGTQAITTEHNVNGVSKSACSLTKDQINQIAKTQNIYYAAVPEPMFQKGKACGKVFEITVGGACYENHSARCLNSHAKLGQFKQNSGKAPPKHVFKVFIADSCGSCIKDARHFDIGDHLYKSGAGKPLRDYLTRHIQAVKRGITTAQPNNLFLSNVREAGCVKGMKVESWVNGGQVPCANK